MRISDWSSDVCSSDLAAHRHASVSGTGQVVDCAISDGTASLMAMLYGYRAGGRWEDRREANRLDGGAHFYDRSEEHTSELQSIMRISYAVFCLQKTKIKQTLV